MTRGSIALWCTLWLCGCGDDGREPLVVYSAHGEDILREFEQRFEAAHPTVDVQTFNMSPQDAFARIKGEREHPSCDVWWGAPTQTMALAAAEGLLDPYTPSCAAAIPPEYQDAGHHWVGQFLLPQVIMYSANRLDAKDAPVDWDDLASPAWKGRVILRIPMQSGGMRTSFTGLIDWKSNGTGDPTAGYAFLTALHQNTKRYAVDPTELFDAVTKDDANVVTIWNLTDALFQRSMHGYPFGVVMPKSGTPLVVDGLALVKRKGDDAARGERARAFAEAVLAQDALDVLMTTHFRIPTRTDVPAERKPKWLQDLVIARLPYDSARAAANERAWMSHWDEAIKPLKRD